VAFIDESGSIAGTRFFAVGCLKFTVPSVLLRKIQKLRDLNHFYRELHFKGLKQSSRWRPVVRVISFGRSSAVG